VRRVLTGVNWKAFAVLLGAGLLGVVAVLPYVRDLVDSSIFGQVAASDLPMPLVLTHLVMQIPGVIILTGML
jgi:hypothetical protein